MKDIDNIFSDITNIIINYKDGDVFAITDLINELNLLKAYFDDNPKLNDFIVFLKEFLRLNITERKHDNITAILSEGIDILQNANKKGQQSDLKYLYNKIDNLQAVYSGINGISENKESNIENKEVSIINKDLINNFISDAEEKIMRAQELILKLENDPENYDFINELFRIYHTIKGECGFLKIASLGELSHNIESILDLLRDKKISINPDIIEILLEGKDYSMQILNELKKGEGIIINNIPINDYVESINKIIEKDHKSLGKILLEKNKLSENDVQNILNEQKMNIYTKKFGEIALDNSYMTKNEVEESLSTQKEKKDIVENSDKAIKSDSIIKVKASRINYLVDMIGELLIVEGQSDDFSKEFSHKRKIIRSIHYAAMQLRTEKVKSLFLNMKRIIRDVSKKLNKTVIFETVGEEIEIDRNLIENLEEPLMHLVRNSIHHGIESKEERIKKNKIEIGKIIIEAERKGNNIIVSVMDDGAGLNKEKILKKALEKGILKKENINNISDNEIYNFIFIQGFSTAENVDLVSGRGVGMDIVSNVILSMRGKIEIKTEKDKFTKISLIFPVNTAIIDGMLVKIDDDIFVVPVNSIVNSIKINKKNVHKINNIEVLDYKDESIPIINLRKYLEFADKDLMIKIGVIVECLDKKKFILTVDEIIAKKEVVIKSLGKKFNKLKGVTSGTVLSGGKVGLVLDIDQIIEHNKILDLK